MTDIMMLLGHKPPHAPGNGKTYKLMSSSENDRDTDDKPPKAVPVMAPAQRQKLILQHLRYDGPETLTGLMKIFGFTHEMVADDLRALRVIDRVELKHFGNYWVWWAR